MRPHGGRVLAPPVCRTIPLLIALAAVLSCTGVRAAAASTVIDDVTTTSGITTATSMETRGFDRNQSSTIKTTNIPVEARTADSKITAAMLSATTHAPGVTNPTDAGKSGVSSADNGDAVKHSNLIATTELSAGVSLLRERHPAVTVNIEDNLVVHNPVTTAIRTNSEPITKSTRPGKNRKTSGTTAATAASHRYNLATAAPPRGRRPGGGPLSGPTSAHVHSHGSSGGGRRPGHHHEHHWGPFFEEPSLERTPDEERTLHVTAYQGRPVVLNCRVGMLRDKTVTWLRRTADRALLLTVGSATYSADARLSVLFQYPNNWRLRIDEVRQEDQGVYLCQVSTHPPRALQVNVTVNGPAMRIVDESGYDVKDRYYKLGSTISLTCQFAVAYLGQLQPPPSPPQAASTTPAGPGVAGAAAYAGWPSEPALVWKRNGQELAEEMLVSNFNGSSDDWLSSGFSIEGAGSADAGVYSCNLYDVHVDVQVHVLNDETQAAVHHDTSGTNCLSRMRRMTICWSVLIYALNLS